MANKNRVTIVINADGTAAIETFDKVSDTAGRTGEGIEKKTASLTSRIKKHWLGVSASVTAAYLAASKAWNLAEQAAKYEQSRQAFKSMVTAMGLDAQVEFAKIKQMSAGLIDNKTLTEAANRAMSLGIGIEHMGDLMQIARAKARDMGTTTTQAFDDIVTGIGRASPMILDNLGLTLKVGEANEAHAKALHKTVEQLTAKEQKQAILNAVLAAGTESLERHNLELLTQAERMQKTQATIANMKLTLGALITRLGVGFLGVFDVVKTVFLGIGAAITAVVGGPFQLLFDVIAKLGGPEITIVYDTFDKQLELIGKSARSAGDNFRAMVASSEDLAGGIRKVGGAAEDAGAKLKAVYEAYGGAKQEQLDIMAVLENDARREAIAQEDEYARQEMERLRAIEAEQAAIKQENLDMQTYANAKFRAQEIEAEQSAADARIAVASHLATTLATLGAAMGKKGAALAKAGAYLQAVVSTAAGMARALKDYPYPYSTIVAGLVGAAGAVQIATISSAQYGSTGGSPSFAAGAGYGASPEAPKWEAPYSYERSEYGTGFKPGESQQGYQIVVHGDVYAQDSEEFRRKVVGHVQDEFRDFNSDTSNLARRATGAD